MARMTFEELNEKLDACIEAGVIFNVDFKDWTSYGAHRMLYDAIGEVRAQYTHAGKWEDLSREELDLIDSLSDSIVQFPTKKTQKMLDGMIYVGPAAAVTDLIRKFKPMADKFRTLKPMIVKGRKPSTEPRKTEERTLENTGTCPVCGKNVKMDANGKMVAHGFTIRYGFQEGNCFGVGYKPVEVSPEGMIAYVEMLRRVRTLRTELKAKLENERPALMTNQRPPQKIVDGDSGYQHILNNRVNEIEGELRFIEKSIEMFTGRIENWAAQPLPGDILKGVAA